MKCYLRFAAIFCATAVLSAISASANTVTVQVGAGGLKFSPQDVTINVGDTVQWTWVGNDHSTTSGTPGNPNGIWDSGVQNTGATFSFTFSTPGTFPYFCTVHGGCCGMIGSVTVNQQIDTVTITKATYTTSRMQLAVQATDTNDTATLTVTDRSGATIGTLRNLGGGSYSGKFNGIANPVKITVTSNFGGSATKKVQTR